MENSSVVTNMPHLRTMGAVRYIGSKARVVDEILDIVGPPTHANWRFVDAFCGTGVVAETAAERGWPVRLNDQLRSATVMARARILAEQDVPFDALGGYEQAIAKLNRVPPRKGFFWREYSPASGRMYFTEDNARRIDAARASIEAWEQEALLSDDERDLLVADLIASVNRVANIAGTYGCYLSRWTSAARRPFELERRSLRGLPVDHEVFNLDVIDLPIGESDLAYFDPPYTKRQYAAYYHILETLAWGDEPEVTGKTGLRPWRDLASDYCYKSRALGALVSLLSETGASRIYLSYSSEGHVDLEDLEAEITPLGQVTVHELGPIGRYRPNQEASATAADVTEYVVELRKTVDRAWESIAA